MSKHNLWTPLIKALAEGNSYVLKLPEEGDLASMRAVLKPGQELTISPVLELQEITVGDIVYLRWLNGNHILHLVGEIQGEQFLIIKWFGKVNVLVYVCVILF
jgi:hypothetical protein